LIFWDEINRDCTELDEFAAGQTIPEIFEETAKFDEFPQTLSRIQGLYE
jgi:hypothetical protein